MATNQNDDACACHIKVFVFGGTAACSFCSNFYFRTGWCGLKTSGTGQEPLACCCAYGSEPTTSVKDRIFLLA